MEFLSNYGLIILLVVLLGFMFWSSRRRTQKQKIEQEKKARETVPGAEVLMQGGLYGTIISFDPENLDQPAIVQIAPGAEIYVIDPAKCTECVGHFDVPQCVEVCPVDCIPVNPDFVETRDALKAKYEGLMAAGQATTRAR